MSCCGSCDLYWPEGKENYGITCSGDQCREECTSNLQSLIFQLRTAMETPKDYPISDQNEQCLQALRGIERNLERIADMYKKTELIKLGILDTKRAFPEYKDIFEAHEKELREIWMPRYELSPKKELTTDDIFSRFKDKYPNLANHVCTYYPAEEPDSIVIKLDIQSAATGSSIIIYNNETAEIKETKHD